MQNISKLFEMNPQSNYKLNINKGTIIFHNKTKEFSGRTISQIINFVNTVHKKYKMLNVPLKFLFGNIELVDKLSYILFECICYYLIKKYNHKIYILWNPKKTILTDGIFSSPLNILSTNHNSNNFCKKFNMDIYKHHYRRLIEKSNDTEYTNYLGKLLQEIDTFFKYFSIVEDYRNQISEVITELVGNACEHGNTDCLLDVDITNNYLKSISNIRQEGTFYGINISIVNFSDILLGDGIKNKFNTNKLNTDRHMELKRAYNYHQDFFSNDYSFVDFCNISSLQDKISGRKFYNLSGGTGLTKLIHSLQEKSDFDSCYVVSGNRSIFFDKDFLDYDDNYWLGFNIQKDFFNSIPDKNVVSGCHIFLPGTAYNLNFVMKREDA